ncbi:hybrid sensor histidine kinase/response regulator [Jannaschia marina]|uniref:hybrid sensor histidine kinase/response regulator n=1 Tax=Jannaschia marina TaxID=2741674 RepID=UPI0015C94E0E|nr:PAS domain-containing protein [Jannaschia marina]
MDQDERLREALLELQLLRDREARVHAETQTLLDCLEAYSAAPGPGEALTSLFVSLRGKIGSDLSLLVARDAEGDTTVAATDRADVLGQSIVAPFDLFRRPRNISDLSVTGDWSGAVDVAGFRALLVAPVSGELALLTFRRLPTGFRKDDINLVQRLSGLAAQALRNLDVAAEKDMLAATISGSSSGVAIADATDPARPLVYVNQAFERISGYAAAEVLGRNCRFLSDEPPDAPERARLRAAVATCAPGTFVLRNRRRDGTMFWNELTLFPVRDGAGQVRKLVATQTDVTDRIRAGEERDRLRQRMESALAATDDAFLVLDGDGRVAFANAAVDLFFPLPQGEWTEGADFDTTWAAYLDGCSDLPGRVTRRLRAADFTALARLGTSQGLDLPDGRSLLVRAGRLDDGGFAVSATDVTAMRSAQNLLAQRLAAIEATADGIAMTDEDGRLVYLNAAAAALLGYDDPGRALGRRWRAQYRDAPARTRGGAFQTTVSRTDGSAVQTHEITGSPLDGGGSIIVIRDITETLETEAREEELTKELIRLQRQEAIAQLTAGIAHDFNNLLSAITGSATLIEMQGDLPPEVAPHLARIGAAGTQAAKLIARLLDIGADSETDGLFEVSTVLSDLPALVDAALPGGIAFDIRADRPALALRGDPGTLSQILVNLALNARDAIGSRRGRITLSVDTMAGSEAPVPAVGRLDPARSYAVLAVSDDGAGMDAATAERIFTPYFTTKGRLGSGLGLATMAMQARSVGGAVAVESAPAQGTTITLFWPLATGGGARAPAPAPGTPHLDGRTVIVVDDDPNVGAVVAGYLEAHGAEVTTCEDPRDAAEAIEEDPDAWSALVTDYDMPGLTGGALAARARAAAPDLPILVITALARRLSDPRVTDDPGTRVLPKPVDLEALLRALASPVRDR